jgi:hypothetical protein
LDEKSEDWECENPPDIVVDGLHDSGFSLAWCSFRRHRLGSVA